MRLLKAFLAAIALLGLTPIVRAQVVSIDNFDTTVNYITNGVVGTVWDGLYLGAGQFNGSTGNGSVAGSVSVADADISSNNFLTVSSLQTDWESAADDGFFLFKVITGDFDMSVHVMGIGNVNTNTPFNIPGLMARAFGSGGAPAPGGTENFLLWGRFNEFNNANIRKNNVNGVKTDTGLGTNPNSNYWLRIERIGNVFNLYEKALEGDQWISVGTTTRADFAGLPLQAGIEHATYASTTTRTGYYEKFSLTASNLGPFAPPPPPTGLVVTNSSSAAGVSWTPDAASTGSLVVISPGGGPVKEMPASGFAYTGNAAYGLGSTLPGTAYYVAYSGAGTNVLITNLPAATSFNVSVYGFTGAGSTMAYTRNPAIASFSTPAPPAPASTNVVVDPPAAALTNFVTLGDWNTDGNFDLWTTSQIPDAMVTNGMLSGTAGGSDPFIALSAFAGPDLDLAFYDYIEIRLQVPAGFAGNIPIYYGTTFTAGIATGSLRVFTIPNGSIPQDGAFHIYRVFIGPQVFWRSNLRDIRVDPLGSSATLGQTFAIDYVRVGDLPGDVYQPRYSVNNPAPGNNDTANNLPVMDMQSKHFRILWDAAVASNASWNANMPHGTLRNLEECWKTHIWLLGYTEPSQSWIPGNRNGTKYKVNMTTFYGGYFSGGDSGSFGWLNITPDGLRVDPPTLVPPHEFGHVCQMHQNPNGAQNMDGQFWEHHANYVRERWMYYYGPNLPGWTDGQSNLDPNYSYLSHMWIGHGRDYYLCWPFFLYLDENPDGLQDLGEGFVPSLWKTEPAGEYIWTTIQNRAPHNSLRDIIGYVARRNVMWDYSHRTGLQAAQNTGNADMRARWVTADLKQRPDDPTWWQVPLEFAPQQTGYKYHQFIPQGSGAGRVVTVNFHGLPYTNGARFADWRASFVVVSDTGTIRYSSLWNSGTNAVTLAANENTVYLSVAGTPNQFLSESIEDLTQPYQSAPSKVRFPYELQVTGATPGDAGSGVATNGLIPHPNGGGWKATTAIVDATAYIGPNARVLNTAQVRNNARVEDFAVVKNSAQVLNNAIVSGHAIVRNTAVVSGNAKVRDYATIIDNSQVRGNARVLEHGQLTQGYASQDWSTIKGSVSTWKDTTVDVSALSWNDAVLDGDFSTARSISNGFQFGFKEYDPGPTNWILARTAPRRIYAYYEFSTAHDSLAKDFYGVTDGYLQGGPVWTSFDGTRSGFLNFNGSSQYVILDRSVSDVQEISVAAWVKWAGGAANQPVWHFGSATNKCMYFTPDDGTGHAKFVIRNGGADQTLTAPAALPTNLWRHVVVTLSNNVPSVSSNLTARLYVNGVLQQTAGMTINPDQLNAPNSNTGQPQNYIARGVGNFLPFYTGAVDSLRIYTGPLTAAEITALAPANQTPSFTGTVSNQTTPAGVTLTVTNVATDPDLPWQTLAFSVVTGPQARRLIRSAACLPGALRQARRTRMHLYHCA
jgi:hypothetical protein